MCRDSSFFMKKENFRNIADVFFFPWYLSWPPQPCLSLFWSEATDPSKTWKVDKSPRLLIHPPLFGHIHEEKLCGDTPKHQCWAGNQFLTVLDRSKQECAERAWDDLPLVQLQLPAFPHWEDWASGEYQELLCACGYSWQNSGHY